MSTARARRSPSNSPGRKKVGAATTETLAQAMPAVPAGAPLVDEETRRRAELDLLTAAEPAARVRALRVLALAGGPVGRLGPLALRALGDDAPEVRGEGARALAQVGLSPAAAALLERLLRHGSSHAAEAEAACASLATLAPALPAAQRPVVAQAALVCLSAVEYRAAAAPLLRLTAVLAPDLVAAPAGPRDALAAVAALVATDAGIAEEAASFLRALRAAGPAAYGASAVAAALACGSPVARALLLLPLEPGDTGDDRGACRLIAREAAATDPLSLLPARLFASLLRHGAAGVAAATDLFETATDPIAEDVVNQVFAFLTESEFPRTVVRRVAGALLARFPAASTRLRAAIIRSRVAEHPALRAPERRGFAEAFVDEALRASLPDARQEIEHGVTRLGPSALAVLVERMGETPGGSAGAALRRMTGETALAVGERKTAAVAALLAGAARAIGAALDGGRTEDRGGAFLALGKVSSRPALPVREYRVAFNRLIKTRTSPGRWLHDTVEAQGYLAAHPAAAKRGLRGACFRSFFTAMGCHAPVGGNRDTRPADPRLNRPDTESDLFPRMLRALVRLCPMPDTAPHLRWQAVERLRLKFQSMAQGGERWGPLGVLALANALADLARMQPDSTAAPAGVEWGADQHRGRIVRTLLLRLDLAPVAEMAAALCRDFPGDHALDGHAAALIAMALARLDRGEEVEPEERRRLCRIAAFSARRPVIGDPKSHDGLRRRVLRALAARVPDGATEVRDLRDDLARYTRQPTGETAKT